MVKDARWRLSRLMFPVAGRSVTSFHERSVRLLCETKQRSNGLWSQAPAALAVSWSSNPENRLRIVEPGSCHPRGFVVQFQRTAKWQRHIGDSLNTIHEILVWDRRAYCNLHNHCLCGLVVSNPEYRLPMWCARACWHPELHFVELGVRILTSGWACQGHGRR